MSSYDGSTPLPVGFTDDELIERFWWLADGFERTALILAREAEAAGRASVSSAGEAATRPWREDAATRALIKEFGETEQRCREAILRRHEADGIAKGERADLLFTRVLDAVYACAVASRPSTTEN